MSETVGVLGSSGTIGRCVAKKLLDAGVYVMGGQRSKDTIFEKHDRFKYVRTDISDEESLAEFCRQCSIVINCISPAYIYGNIVAKAAAVAGAVYIDGVDVINDKKGLPEDGIYIKAGGFVPGLSEYIPLSIAQKEFDIFERAVIYQGGTELCSNAAFADIILSAGVSGYGDAFLYDGNVKPFRSRINNRYELAGFDKKMMLKAYLGNEMHHLGVKAGLKRLYWFNAYEDMHIIKLLMDSMRISSGLEKNKAAEKIIEYVATERDKLTRHNDIYSLLGIELQGKKEGRDKYIQCVLYLRDSSRLCGYMLAETALSVLKRTPSRGIYCAYELIDEDYLYRIKDELSDGESFIIREIPPEEAILADKNEKGILQCSQF